MPAPAKPTTAFDPTKVTFGVKTFAVFTPTGGAAVNFVGKLFDEEYKLDTVDRKVPDAQGVLRTDRTAAKSADEKFTLVDIEEIDEVIAAMTKTAIVPGSVQFFICDPLDVTLTVRWLSDAFACTAMVKSGTTKYGDGKFSTVSLEFISNKGAAGAVVWTPKATTT